MAAHQSPASKLKRFTRPAWPVSGQALEAAPPRHALSCTSLSAETLLDLLRTDLQQAIEILGEASTRLLRREGLDRRSRNDAQDISTAVGLIETLVADACEYDELTRQSLETRREHFDPLVVLTAVSHRIREACWESRLGFELLIDPSLPRDALGDSSRLVQIIETLYTTATRSLKHGGLLVRVRQTASTARTSAIEYSLECTPEGPADPVPLPEGDGSTLNGSAIGLAFCKGLASHLGGEIHFYHQLDNAYAYQLRIELEKGSS